MAGKSIERMIRLLLDEVKTAVAASDWHTVERRAREILALDPHHTEATQYLAAAGRVFRFGPVAPRGRRFRLPRPSLPAIRIPAPPAAVSGALGVLFVFAGRLTLPARRWSVLHAFLPLMPLFVDEMITMRRRIAAGEDLWAAHRSHVTVAQSC